MGFLFKDITPEREIAVWQADGCAFDGSDFTGAVTAADLESAARFTAQCRRSEHLSARAALRSLLPETVLQYDANGGPLIAGGGLHVGLSHCRGAGAAVVSRVPCAVDIESADRNFSRAVPRYLSPGELTVPGSGHPLFAAAAWCAKETLYKLARRPGTAFLGNMTIEAFDPAGGTISARLLMRPYIIGVRTVAGYIICFTPL